MNAPFEEHRDAAFQAELYLKKITTGEEISCQSPQAIYRRLKAARKNVEQIEVANEVAK